MDQRRWSQLSIQQQIGNITSEIVRAKNWASKQDEDSRNRALERALELIDMTLLCQGGRRRREISRLREVTAHCLVRSDQYEIALDDLERYGMQFIQSH